MTEATTRRDTWTIIGTGVALLAILVPLLLTLHGQQTRRLDRLEDALRSEVTALRNDLHAVDSRVQALGERVARIEGRLDAVLPAITLTAPEPPGDQ